MFEFTNVGCFERKFELKAYDFYKSYIYEEEKYYYFEELYKNLASLKQKIPIWLVKFGILSEKY